MNGPDRPRRLRPVELPFDQTNVAGARTLLRVLRRELDPLTFPQQFEHGAAHRAAMEEMLDAAFVADESEPLVDEQPCDCPRWHTPNPSVPKVVSSTG